MTDRERHGALLNIQAALNIARGYVGVDASLSGPVSPERMADILRRAGRDAAALVAEAATGEDVPRPEGTAISEVLIGGAPLLVLDRWPAPEPPGRSDDGPRS